MIRINLLPENKRPSLWPAGGYIFLAAAAAVLLLSVAVALFNYCRIWELNRQTAQIEQQQALLETTAARMEAAGRKQREIANKTGLLLKLTGERSSWHAFLCQLSGVVTPRVWLTEAAVRNKDGGFNVSLKGKALTYDDAAVFLQKLERDEYLQDAVLVKAEKVDSFGGQFEITMRTKNVTRYEKN